MNGLILVAHNEEHAAKLRDWFPHARVIVNRPIPITQTREGRVKSL